MRRKAFLAALLSASLCSIIGVADGAIVGFPRAGDPIASKLERQHPHSSQRFVNCPGNNRISINEVEGLSCEFRLVTHHEVVRGVAAVLPDRSPWAGARWHLAGFHVFASAPLRLRSCGTSRLSGPSQSGYRLHVFGVTCGTAVYLSFQISSRASSAANLRLPKHFTEGENGTNTLGFVTERFHCRGRVEVRQGNPNPYGHEVASCRTRFGDRLKLAFDQGS